MRQLLPIAALSVLAVATASCGDVVRQGRAPVFMVINSLQGSRGAADPEPPSGTLLSDVITNVTSPEPCSPTSPCPTIFDDSGIAVLSISPKDIGTAASPASPSSNNAVTITRYRVTYRRADGRNTPGVDVPYGFDGGVTGTIQSGGTLQLGFELVRHVSKMESPLVQMQTTNTIINTVAEVTFWGRDQVGNEVSATGSMSINFGNFGDF